MYASGVVKDGKVSLQFQHVFAFLKIALRPSDLGERGILGIHAEQTISGNTLLIEDNKLVAKSEYWDLHYHFNDDQRLQTEETSIYVPISPIDEGRKLTFYSFKSTGEFDKYLFLKDTPEGGLLAGHIYNVSATSEIEEYSNLSSAQRNALIDLYNATGGTNWSNNENWCSDKDISEWNGVSVSYGSVYYLGLSGRNLSGTLPESFSVLMDAPYIYLYANNLSGNIPSSVTSHKNWSRHWNRIMYGNSFNLENVPGPTFSLTDLNGNTVTSDVYKNNKLTLLLNWAVWCPYSKAFVPNLVQLYSKCHDKGFEIVGFDNIEGSGWYPVDTRAEMEQYIKDNGITWPNIADAGDGNELYFIGATPLTYIVDSNGYIVYDSSQYGVADFVTNYLGITEDTSTDYSKDGEVFKVQSATVGNGINLVFMGDGFVDKDMENGGLYEERIKEAVDNYFSYEPLKSFRNRFNVYGVKVVSKNNSWKEGVMDHRINENANTAIEYASKVGLRDDEPRFVTVVYNVETYESAGRSYTMFSSDGSYVGYAMERDAGVLAHEVCGHGFGQLLDEYVEGGYENISPTDEEKSDMDVEFEKYGWGANVDWRSDTETIRWARFIKDSRYAGENLGAYEGAATYGKGMYRPTENSMMRFNNAPFNAPSREQIYKNIMKRSEGSSWTYDYEKFVEYDAINRTYNTRSGVTTAPTKADIERFRKHHRAPVYVKGTWRNMMKSNRSSYNGPLR
jgi:thiol-disulfide isomerase/thioredoxin